MEKAIYLGSIADNLWTVDRENKTAGLTKFCLLSLAGSLLISLCSQLSIPFYPVPVTGQTFAVFLVGLTLGSRKAAAAVVMYYLEGLAGLPVFANGAAGAGAFAGPTGGYLLGFLPAAFICGLFSDRERDRHIMELPAIFLLANAAIYLPGLVWLGAVLGWEKPILELGLYPFIFGDALKMALVVFAFPATRKLLAAAFKRGK